MNPTVTATHADIRPSTSCAAPGDARTRRLVGALETARSAGCVLIVKGQGASDLLIDGAGTAARILVVLARAAEARGMRTVAYSLADGVRQVSAGATSQPLPINVAADATPRQAIEQVLQAARTNAPVLAVVDWACLQLPGQSDGSPGGDEAAILERIAGLPADRSWANSGSLLTLVARTGCVDDRLAAHQGVTTLEIGQPDAAERLAFIEKAGSSARGFHLAVDAQTAARMLGGLFLDDHARLRATATADSPVTAPQIIAVKRAAIERLAGSTLQVVSDYLDMETDVAGMPHVRTMIAEKRGTNEPLRLVLAGPPGTGKTRAVSAIAASLGMPAVALAEVKSKWVGETTQNLIRVEATLEAMRPAVLWIDECEMTGLGARPTPAGDAGSQVDADVHAAVFRILGDPSTPDGISCIGTTNLPNRLDPAALDRFSVAPILHPTSTEAAQIMHIHARAKGLVIDIDAARNLLAQHPGLISGRDAVALIDRAHTHARMRNQPHSVNGDNIAFALADKLPSITTGAEYHALQAIAHTTWRSHLPWIAAAQLGLPVEIPSYVQPVIDAAGDIDQAKLHARLRELEASGASH